MELPEVTKENTIELIWSVSLIPYLHSFGYLVGQEFRKKENDIQFHLVGGKTELWDKDPISTATREFIEETSLIGFSYFQEYANERYLEWISQNEISLKTEYPRYTTFLQPLLEESVRKSSKYFDEQVSPPKWKEDHYEMKVHRFYIWDLSKCTFQKEMIEFSFYYSQIHPYLRIHDKMWSLHWIQSYQFYYLPNKSALFVKCMKQIEDQKKKRE